MKDYIEKDSGIPFYIQLKQILVSRIKKGDFPDGRVSSEHEISNKYGVTVNTVRRTFSALKNEGRIYTVQGLGTFIKKPKLEFDFSKYLSFGRVLKERGIKEEIKVIKKEIIDFNKKIYKNFDIINPSKEVVHIERLRFIEEEPLVFESLYYNKDLLEPLFSKGYDERIYDYIVDKLKLNFSKVDEFLEPVILNSREKNFLGLGEKEIYAGLRIIRISYTGDGDLKFMEFGKTTIRGKICRYHVNIV